MPEKNIFVSRHIFNEFHLNTKILTKLRLKKSDPHTHRSILLLLKKTQVPLQLLEVLITVGARSPALLRNTQDGDTHTKLECEKRPSGNANLHELPLLKTNAANQLMARRVAEGKHVASHH